MGKPRYLIAGLCAFLMSSFSLGQNPELEAENGELEPGTEISVHGDTMSVALEEVPLGFVLEELAHQANVSFVIPDEVGEALVSDTFQNLPLQQGIRRLLKGHNYLLEYIPSAAGAGDQAVPLALEIRILDKRPPDMDNIARQRAAAASRRARPESGAVRVSELQNLADQGNTEQLKTALADAIHDTEEEIRETALDILEDMENNAPTDLLQQIALQDPNADFRIRALDALAETHPEEAPPVLEQALRDANAEVRELASELLKDLKEEAATKN